MNTAVTKVVFTRRGPILILLELGFLIFFVYNLVRLIGVLIFYGALVILIILRLFVNPRRRSYWYLFFTKYLAPVLKVSMALISAGYFYLSSIDFDYPSYVRQFFYSSKGEGAIGIPYIL